MKNFSAGNKQAMKAETVRMRQRWRFKSGDPPPAGYMWGPRCQWLRSLTGWIWIWLDCGDVDPAFGLVLSSFLCFSYGTIKGSLSYLQCFFIHVWLENHTISIHALFHIHMFLILRIKDGLKYFYIVKQIKVKEKIL
jgi:hypothetical protein